MKNLNKATKFYDGYYLRHSHKITGLKHYWFDKKLYPFTGNFLHTPHTHLQLQE